MAVKHGRAMEPVSHNSSEVKAPQRIQSRLMILFLCQPPLKWGTCRKLPEWGSRSTRGTNLSMADGPIFPIRPAEGVATEPPGASIRMEWLELSDTHKQDTKTRSFTLWLQPRKSSASGTPTDQPELCAQKPNSTNFTFNRGQKQFYKVTEGWSLSP